MDPSASIKNALPLLFSKKEILITSFLSVAYLLLSRLIIGYKIDQFVLVVLFNVMFYLSFVSRRFITGFSIFIVYWIVFDFMKAIPNYHFNTVHIAGLYEAEKSLFPVLHHGRVITPNEYFIINQSLFLNLLSGVFYLCWVPVPLAFAAWLFFKKPQEFIYFGLTFFLVNLLGFVVYYVYPAAPPWYVQQHGFAFVASTQGNTAGLSRFDAAVGLDVFKSLYAKSSNVFAAMPSLHSAYPVIVLYYGIKNRLGLINIVFAGIMAGIWFAAVYTSHHYVLDVLAGILCAIIGILIFDKLLLNDRRFNAFVKGFLAKIKAPGKSYR